MDAGAKNIPVEDGNPYSTPMEWILTEASFQSTSEIDHALGNIYEAVYRIFLAQEEGRPYHGIDSYEAAVGKKILRVLADAPAGVPVFTTVCTDRYCHENCFSCDFYFQFDGGYLVYCRDTSCFVDTVPPSAPFVDVSACFPQMIGQTIENISFSHHSVKKGLTYYGQPVTIFHLSNGEKISFTINFGEEDKEHYVAYCF